MMDKWLAFKYGRHLYFRNHADQDERMPFSVDYIAQVCPCGCFVALCMCTSRCGLFCAMLCIPRCQGCRRTSRARGGSRTSRTTLSSSTAGIFLRTIRTPLTIQTTSGPQALRWHAHILLLLALYLFSPFSAYLLLMFCFVLRPVEKSVVLSWLSAGSLPPPPVFVFRFVLLCSRVLLPFLLLFIFTHL